jgi:integrase
MAELERRLDAAVTVRGRGRGEGGQLLEETRVKYARAWHAAEAWVRSVQPTVMPWSSETLAQYAVVLLEQGYAKSTVDGRLAAVKAKHRERGEPVPDGVAAWYVLRGANDTAPGRVKVNTPRPRRAALAEIAASLDPARVQAARDLCMVTLGWDLHARVRELVAIDVADVVVVAEGLGLNVRLSGRGVKLGVAHLHEPLDVCPVEATEAWLGHLRRAGVTSGPLFRGVDKGDNIAGCGPKAGPRAVDDRLSESGVRRIWAKLVARAGLPRDSTPADLRLASALDAARNGVPLRDIVARGGWSPSNGDILVKLMRAAEETQ